MASKGLLFHIPAIGLLIAALVYGVTLHGSRPASGPVELDREEAEEDLRERFEEFAEVRSTEDWQAMYELVDPVEREKVDLGSFLNFYGRGVLRAHSTELVEIEFGEGNRSAMVKVATDGELVIEKLPPQYRSNLRVDDPAQLRGVQQHTIPWVWRQGEWYYRLDPEIVTGRDPTGKPVESL